MVNIKFIIYFDMQLQFTLRGIVFCQFLQALDGQDSEIVSPDSPEEQLSGEKKDFENPSRDSRVRRF